MDWTGGARRRFAGSKKGAALQKQKAYFAKVRAGLRLAPSSQRGGFEPEYFRQSIARELSLRERSGVHAHNVAAAGMSQNRASKTLHAASHPNHHNTHYERVPSVVSISSREQSDSMPPSSADRRNTTQSQRSLAKFPIPNHLTAEEQLLLGNRQRLLARTDWLGLAARNPARTRFPSSTDRERIGKRRRIEKSTHRARPAQNRPRTPLFERRLMQGAVMSGALPLEDIQVRIGTDTFASQTARSRRSPPLANSSMRPPSTCVKSLSEESMLLGEDGDILEAGISMGVLRFRDRCAPEARPVTPYSHAQTYSASEKSHNSRVFQRVYNVPSDCDEDRNLDRGRTSTSGTLSGSIHGRRQANGSNSPRTHPQSNHSYTDECFDEAIPRSSGPLLQHHHESQPPLQLPDDDDDFWRKILQVNPNISSHASVTALKSSSQHFTTSESLHRLIIPGQYSHTECDATSISTPNRDGTDSSFVHRGIPGVGEGRSLASQSPSTSLKLITRLAELPAQHARTLKIPVSDDDDDALWRQFIVGSEDDCTDSRDHGDAVFGDEYIDAISMARSSSLLNVSGLGTSDKATVGNTLFATGSTPSPTNFKCADMTGGLRSRSGTYLKSDQRRHPRDSNTEKHLGHEIFEFQTRRSVPNVMAQDAELITSARTTTYHHPHLAYAGISDRHGRKCARASNIHADPSSSRKREEVSRTPIKGNGTRQKRNRRTKSNEARASGRVRSVYDLVDSDNIGLA